MRMKINKGHKFSKYFSAFFFFFLKNTTSYIINNKWDRVICSTRIISEIQSEHSFLYYLSKPKRVANFTKLWASLFFLRPTYLISQNKKQNFIMNPPSSIIWPPLLQFASTEFSAFTMFFASPSNWIFPTYLKY